VFALRLGHYLDQRFITTGLPDAARGMLSALPSMPTQEAIVFGEGVRLPMHIRFDGLPPDHRPRSNTAQFSKAWQASPLTLNLSTRGSVNGASRVTNPDMGADSRRSSPAS
jgi:hypothetical protein